MSGNDKKRNKDKSNSSTSLKNKNIKNIKNIKKINKNLSINHIKLPFAIDRMKHNELTKAFEVISDTFIFLEYSKKTTDEITIKEWHTWQISILLKYLSTKRIYKLDKDLNIFPTEIKSLSQKHLEGEVNLILNRYLHEVDIHLSKNELCQEINWTARDVALILRTITRT